jgi:hypothetical protein
MLVVNPFNYLERLLVVEHIYTHTRPRNKFSMFSRVT